ncbi:hypothetical protein BXT84_09505 [Sulfobacillus thermotolerans]|uniref:O-succinylbenzoate--CoA ligase n=1 Tax=Sulfobacillus thermotolerans TaxID=338644 RepID=A0ABN5H6C1_9FIRM|nr:hypothetical protein BXT84_09505 [Sulfobacillus thermotolerans]
MLTEKDYLFNIPVSLQSYLQGYTLPDVFDKTVARYGHRIAAYDGERSYTWQQWQEDARAFATALANMGIGRGDVVGVHLPNSWEFLVAHVGIAMRGAVMLPLHMAHGEREISALLSRTQARVVITPDQFRGHQQSTLTQHLLETLPFLETIIVVGAQRGSFSHPAMKDYHTLMEHGRQDSWQPVPVRPDDPFMLIASSGTTSTRPKICLHSHDGLLSNAWVTATEGQARPEDIILSGSPFTHLFGILSVHISLLMGGGQSLIAYWNVMDFLERAQSSQATVIFAVPTQLRDMMNALDAHPHSYQLSVREIRTGGAAVPKELIAAVRQHLNAGVVIQWGMSEIGSGIFTRPGVPDAIVGESVGRPAPGAEVRILIEGAPAPVGDIGDLYYRSPYLFHGYYGDPELTAEQVDAEAWLRTGDLASWNADGTIQYRGRATETLNRGGLKFSALEVESLLSDLPEIAQHAILPRPDLRLGERACLAVSFREGASLTLQDICHHLEAKGLAKYKWPEELVVLEKLPTTPTGKIARALLKEAVLEAERNKTSEGASK